MSESHESVKISYSPTSSLTAREELFNLMHNYPGTPEETERSLGLFLRGSLMARIFGVRELYEQIVDLPGIIMDIGTWRGQTAVLCENMRAIFEPLHLNRRIAAFDTFEGYMGFSERDKETNLHKDGTYKVEEEYEALLSKLLLLHEKNNAMGHYNSKHQVIKGDCRETIPKFFEDNKNEFVALAFFDVNSFEPTHHAFKQVYDRLVPGGVIGFWQLTRNSIPAEGMVYSHEILNNYGHRIRRSEFYPGLCYLIKEGR